MTRDATVAAVRNLARHPGRLLVIADFDGTLAEGSRDPAAATVVPLARRALRRLARVAAERPGRVTVAILTGRTSADVAARVRVGGITYLGDHGLQSGSFPRGGDPARLETTFRAGHDASHPPAEALARRVPEVLGRPTWLFVERKGPSVAFHVRQADDRVAARAAVEAAIATIDRGAPAARARALPWAPRRRPAAAIRGRQARGGRSSSLRTSGRRRPSRSVTTSATRTGSRSCTGAREAGVLADALAVAVTGPHGMPDEVRAAADIVLPAPIDAARALSALASTLEGESGPEVSA